MGYNDFQMPDDLSARLTKELSPGFNKILDLEMIKGDSHFAAVAYAAVESKVLEGFKVRASSA